MNLPAFAAVPHDSSMLAARRGKRQENWQESRKGDASDRGVEKWYLATEFTEKAPVEPPILRSSL
jgi:hypothetical protein